MKYVELERIKVYRDEIPKLLKAVSDTDSYIMKKTHLDTIVIYAEAWAMLLHNEEYKGNK